MSTTKIRLWYVRESEKAYQYTKLPPDRQRNPDDMIWIPKSQVEQRSKQPNGLHELTLPDWIVEAKNLLVILSLSLALGCSSLKPKLPLGSFPSESPPIPLTIEGPMMFHAAGWVRPPWTNVTRWLYPTNDTNAYFWDFQESTNLTSWTTVLSNVSSADITVRTTNQFRLYRMRGHK